MMARTFSGRAMCLSGLLLAWLVLVGSGSALAQSGSTPAPSQPPSQVQEILRLLQDPAVRTWLDEQHQAAPAPASVAPEMTTSERLAGRIARTREHLASLAAAVPRLPDEFRAAGGRLSQEMEHRTLLGVMVLVLGFLGLGAGTEWLFGRATASARERAMASSADRVSDRVRGIAARLGFGLVEVAIFGLGSIGAFLAFDWPSLMRQIVLSYLVAALMLRLALVLGRVLLAPSVVGPDDVERYRVVPMPTAAARFWYRRLALFAAWFAFGWGTVNLVHALGFTPEARELIAYVLGLGLLAIALEATWRWSASHAGEPEEFATRHHTLVAWLLSAYFVLLWGLWVVGLMGLFWLAVVFFVLPRALAVSERSSRHLLRPAAGEDVHPQPGLARVYLDRGVRALVVVGAALLLTHVWNIDLVEMTSRDTLLTHLLRGILSSVVILLVADLIWQIAKTLIDQRLARIAALAPPGSPEALQQARLRTLLPIFRSVIFVVLATIAVLMALSSLGVEIGPLIAGAGIVGVAVGFGSQTLVKDVISGVFYLLDDAFRVGEYIQSGSYKGTVESLGFRSLKLRHHRGPIFTVPYGQLGAVENMSRDWVIDKMMIGVTYDSDLDLAKKIIKQVGKDLAQDPEFAPHIIEPLKMQGVEQFGEYAIQLRLKMMTRPGEQFAIRRKANTLIKKAFDENGIKFAFPTVQVAGREDLEPAVAHEGLKLIKPAVSE